MTHRRVSPFPREVIFTRARVSLALLSLREKVASAQTSFGVRLSRIHFSPKDVCGRLGKMGTTRSLVNSFFDFLILRVGFLIF